MDHSKLDHVKDKAIIIARALYATTPKTFEDDIIKLEELYSPSDIVKYLKLTSEKISNKVCKSISERYGVPEFKRFALSY